MVGCSEVSPADDEIKGLDDIDFPPENKRSQHQHIGHDLTHNILRAVDRNLKMGVHTEFIT